MSEVWEGHEALGHGEVEVRRVRLDGRRKRGNEG